MRAPSRFSFAPATIMPLLLRIHFCLFFAGAAAFNTHAGGGIAIQSGVHQGFRRQDHVREQELKAAYPGLSITDARRAAERDRRTAAAATAAAAPAVAPK